MELKRTVELAMLLSLSVILNLIEGILPITFLNIPGIKIGLANTIILFAIYYYQVTEVILLLVLRIILIGLLRTGLFSLPFFFSLGGGMLSVLSMIIVKKTPLSVIGISIIGSLFHNIGQVLTGTYLLKIQGLISFLPYLCLFSIITGTIVGLIVKRVLDYYSINY